MLDSDAVGPINLGNPTAMTVLKFAHLVLQLRGSASPITGEPLPEHALELFT